MPACTEAGWNHPAEFLLPDRDAEIVDDYKNRKKLAPTKSQRNSQDLLVPVVSKRTAHSSRPVYSLILHVLQDYFSRRMDKLKARMQECVSEVFMKHPQIGKKEKKLSKKFCAWMEEFIDDNVIDESEEDQEFDKIDYEHTKTYLQEKMESTPDLRQTYKNYFTDEFWDRDWCEIMYKFATKSMLDMPGLILFF